MSCADSEGLARARSKETNSFTQGRGAKSHIVKPSLYSVRHNPMKGKGINQPKRKSPQQ